MALTPSQISLGITSNGTTITGTNGNLNIAGINANFQYTKITNNGYTAAVSQSFNQSNDPSVSQAAISQSSYIEQVTYQSAGHKLPSAFDLTYGTFTMFQTMNGIAGSQYVVANLGGVSYITQINKLNGTTAMNYGAIANPNVNNTLILTVDYTASQWNSISSAPSFWANPLGTIEYYWYYLLGALFGVIGLAGWKASSVAKDEGLRGRR